MRSLPGAVAGARAGAVAGLWLCPGGLAARQWGTKGQAGSPHRHCIDGMSWVRGQLEALASQLL